jgi:hypothetical protein
MEYFQIQMVRREVTQTSPAKAHTGFWLTRTSSDKAVWLRPINPD